METVAKPKEMPEVFSLRDSYVAQSGDSVEKIATKLWIRASGMPKGLWNVQPWDKFELQLGSKWTATIKKSRPETTPWTKLEAVFTIELSKVYQDIEKCPQWFPYVSFRRNPQKNTYTMLDVQWNSTGIDIPTANLDEFRNKITQISGVIITECSARNNEHALACDIRGVRWFETSAFALNDSWMRFFSNKHKIDMEPIYTLTMKRNEDPNAYYILKTLINSASSSIDPNITSKIAKK